MTTEKKKAEGKALALAGNSRAMKGDHPLDATITIRCSMPQKNDYVRAAKTQGQKLSEWLLEAAEQRLEREKQEENDDRSSRP